MNEPASVPHSQEPGEASDDIPTHPVDPESAADDLASIPASADTEHAAGTGCGVDLGDEYEPV
jgi:hypothetical protein